MKFFKSLAFIGVVVVLSACGSRGKEASKGGKVYGGVFTYCEKNSVQTFHPPFVSDESSVRITQQIFEGLVKWDPVTLEITPSLAESYTFDYEKFTYIFKLKQGVYFHDDPCFENGKGRELTSQDVVYTFENICKKQLINTPYYNLFKDVVKGANSYFTGSAKTISGISAPDKYTVRIQLLKPNDAFLNKLGGINYAIFAKEAYEKYGIKNKVGTGPFIPLPYDKYHDHQVLLKNPNYHGKDNFGNQLPFLDSVIISFDKGIKQQIEAVKSGKQSAVMHLPSKPIKELVAGNKTLFKQNLKLESSELLSSYYIEFNLLDPMLVDTNFRKAISYGIDRSKLTQIIFGTTGANDGNVGIIPPSLPNYQTGLIKGYSFNLDSAKYYFNASGILDSIKHPTLELDIAMNDYKALSIANELQIQFEQNLGIHLKINIVPQAYKLEKSRYGKGQLSISSFVAHYPSPESFLSLFYGKSVPANFEMPSFPNTMRYKNHRFDKLIERGRKCVAQEDAFRRYAAAEKVLMENPPILVLWYEEANALLKEEVQDLPLNSILYFDLSKVYLGKASNQIPESIN